MTAEAVPAGLAEPGQKLWKSVVSRYILTPAELTMLAEACRTADELTRLEQALRELPELTVPGSMGQPRPHPLLQEVRNHRLLLERLTSALNLPDDFQEVGLRPGQRHARTAALARWGRRGDGDASEAAERQATG